MYFRGYLIEVINYGSQYKFTIYQQGALAYDGFSKTHNGAITKAKRVISVFQG